MGLIVYFGVEAGAGGAGAGVRVFSPRFRPIAGPEPVHRLARSNEETFGKGKPKCCP